MIQIKNITKKYLTEEKENEVVALKDVSINFRNSEFVSILGPSGCGKTTLLNIVGGLDKYSEGDLFINGVSTKEYTDRDWDSYRNHSVGFVFQSYNLIPHQTVLQNVELALTLAGISKSERRSRAISALEQVGLQDQLNKKPNAMSGGQMQRVAIARALVNNPDIILADEPTGALDTETSLQVMEILKNVSKERLVVMVTHNPELAEQYSTRIIKMVDGKIVDDTKPYADENYKRAERKEIKKEELEQEVLLEESGRKKIKEKKPTMSFWTAFKLSLKNLFTKKARTMLTSFAGSIGIIGIALILAVSQGTTGYIDYIQETTLASYPLTLEAKTIDMGSLISSFMNVGKGEVSHEKDAIYKDPIIAELVEALSNVKTNENDLKSFKTRLEQEVQKEGSQLRQAIKGIQYTYDMQLNVYTKNIDGKIIKSDTNEVFASMLSDFMLASMSNGGVSGGITSGEEDSQSAMAMSSGMMGMKLWQEMLPGVDNNEIINSIIYEQYELVDNGSWPNEYDEIVLVVNENNELDDLTLYALGLLSEAEIDAIIEAASTGQTLETSSKSWTYDEIKNLTFKTILPCDCYRDRGDGVFVDVSEVDTIMSTLYDNALSLKVTGIVRPKKDADAQMLKSGIGYTNLLTEYVINKACNSEVVLAQQANPTVDVLTGKPFKSNTGSLTPQQKQQSFIEYIDNLSVSAKADAFISIKSILSAEELMQKTAIEMANYPEREDQIALISAVVAQEMEGVDANILNGYFAEMTDEQVMGFAFAICQANVQKEYAEYIAGVYNENDYTDAELVGLLNDELQGATEEQFVIYYDNVTEFSSHTYEEILTKLGCLDIESPATINIYATSFENKDIIVDYINTYNSNVDESQKISYTDYIGLLMSSVTTIINAITYVLIAFVAISLIVSSIMIGVITLISVQERTKEIGILRAIGASKGDVSSMFNAETLIIGFTSGLTGVLVTYILCIPINLILNALTGIAQLKAVLPIGASLILIVISMLLTLISGIIPSHSAAKKDPVVALRTE